MDTAEEEVTAIMNDLANGTSTNTTTKSKRTADDAQLTNKSPRKRVTVDLPAPSEPSVVSPRRQSGRLQLRRSLPALPTPRLNGTIYDIPGDDEQQHTPQAIEPVKRLRALQKQKDPQNSPFKGWGVLETKSTARVYLDDSPAKNTRTKSLDKIKKSLQRSVNPEKRPLVVRKTVGKAHVTPRRSVRQSMMAEDPIEAAERYEDEPLTPGLGLKPSGKEAVRKALAEFSPLKADQRRVRVRQQDETTALDVDATTTQMRQDARNNEGDTSEAHADEFTQSLNAHQEEEDEGTAGRDEEEDEEEDEDGEPSSTSNPKKRKSKKSAISRAAPSEPPTLRPESEAEIRTRLQTEKEDAEKARQLRHSALKGVRKAVKYHDLKKPWTELLVAVVKLEEVRSTPEPTSTRGRGLQRPLDSLLSAYRDLASQEPRNPQAAVQRIGDDIRLCKARLKDIHKWRLPTQQCDVRERSRMAKDIYQHLIPSSIILAKTVLKARYRDSELSITAHKELVQILELTRRTVSIGREWQPRPQLESGLKKLIVQSIAANVDKLLDAYENVISQDADIQYLDDLEVKQRADLAAITKAEKQRRDAVRQKYRLLTVPPQYRNPTTNPHITDIDDIPLGPSGSAEQHLPPTNASTTSTPSPIAHRTGANYASLPRSRRPPLPRQATEDIPAPTGKAWTAQETIVLLNALARFTTPTRFHDIMSKYGGSTGLLRRFTMDEIIEQAKFVKESMKADMAQVSDTRFDFLRSVPA